jgi:hypothetical protein
MWVSTSAASGVTPSAACQMAEAVGLRLKSEESRPDMIIISPPIRRAATFGARAT